MSKIEGFWKSLLLLRYAIIALVEALIVIVMYNQTLVGSND